MITIRLSMNGESPMIFPVSGSRSGAPGMTVSSAIASEHGERRPQRVAQAARLVRGRDLGRLVGGLRSPRRPSAGSHVAEPALDELRGDDRQHDRDEDRRADAEVQVRGEVDVVRRRQPLASFVISVSTPSSGVIRKFTPKPAATPANAAAMPGERVPPDALEGRGPEWDQHEVARVARRRSRSRRAGR